MASKEEVLEVLKTIFDPEIPVNIVDLGLIYGLEIDSNNDVTIHMTLTSVGCPLHLTIQRDIEEKIKTISGVNEVRLDLVWDPPWTPARMSPEAKAQMGFVEIPPEQQVQS
ncbi:TPA: DUF59 domain-containing protein [archaeon]|nr:DUF59 domain-containing protein [Candidatus Naiadarchaeales archaeon SRR2090159.bin1288]